MTINWIISKLLPLVLKGVKKEIRKDIDPIKKYVTGENELDIGFKEIKRDIAKIQIDMLTNVQINSKIDVLHRTLNDKITKLGNQLDAILSKK